ncbi:MAG: hypothetical protein M1829_002418 [Trizodia sp. TS-e1964]|nr:MAG: hypothetical protein M1829_002418 [Trizodia sp. TS-e1964]
MSLTDIYISFLAAPSANILSENCSLNYITTLKTINNAQNIIKELKSPHLKVQQSRILSTVVGDNSIALEIDTNIEFISSGGSYLPGLDDNFLADRRVNLPIIHMVDFDTEQMIQQIRVHWDQGSLLKLIDVIGVRGKNWPITDGKDQVRLIASSKLLAKNVSARASAPRDPNTVVTTSKGAAANGSQHITGDPHASLSLFAPRDPNQQSSYPTAIAPRASAKPPPRDYHDLFVGNDSDNSAPPSAAKMKGRAFRDQGNPLKQEPENFIAPKGGAGKNFRPSRLFDEDDQDVVPSPTKGNKANPTKKGLDISNMLEEENEPLKPIRPRSSKHQSQWDFEDMVSAVENTKQDRIRGQVRHFALGDDEVQMESPVKNPKVDKPRRDAETHFQFQDDGTPDGERRLIGRPKGAAHNSGLGLYQNNMYDDAKEIPKEQAEEDSSSAYVKNHRKFDSQFELRDDSPATNKKRSDTATHKEAVKMMNSQWEAYDVSPNESRKDNARMDQSARRMNTGIKTAGDGMGGKSGAGRNWGIGDCSDGEDADGVNGTVFQKGIPGKKQHAATSSDIWNF